MKSKPMELALNTYYMFALLVARRADPAASGKALAAKKNVRLCSAPAQAADLRERKLINRSMKKFVPICSRPNFRLDRGFMKMSCALAAPIPQPADRC
jgi:hypothetical protein